MPLAAGLLAGASALAHAPLPLPAWGMAIAALLVVPLACLGQPLFAGVAAGLALAGAALDRALDDRLAQDMAGNKVLVSGVVTERPRALPGRMVFTLAVESPATLPGRIRLSWYEAGARPAPGERWRFLARLRAPHGLVNPGGMDWEGWLLRQGVGATGYASGDSAGRRLSPAAPFAAWRAAVAERIESVLEPGAPAAVVTAITVGFRGGLESALRDDLAATGTGHLLAISGLHVGLAAGVAGLLAGLAWRRLAPRAWPARDVAAIAAVLAAVVYGLAAGLPVSARRAVIMVSVAALALLLRRPGRPAPALAAALLVVLAHDPLAVLDPGLWLSFAAVATILAAVAGRCARPGRVAALVRIQAALAVGLLGLGAAWFGRVSVVAPLANLVAVPWFSLFVVPPALLGLALHGPAPILADLCFVVAGRAVEVALPVLERLAAWPAASFRPMEPRPWAVLAALLGAAWCLLPRPGPGRAAAAALVLPLLWWRGPGLAEGEYEVHVLDVGQGLAVLIRTRGHAVLYDTGPVWPGGDAGQRVVLPALGALGVKRLDVMVLSHGDADHAGGATSVLAAMPADRRIGGAGVTSPGFESCHHGQRWTAGGVAFEILHPGAAAPASENDGSCVLLVSGPGGRTLLTGDLERSGERQLLRVAASLRAELVVAPHHGSRSSSTPSLVDASQPGWVAFAAGHGNRWGFPAGEVVARWRAAGALPLSTDRHGALVVRFGREGAGAATTLRQADCRAWRDCR